jgi:hypothetical protein
MRKYKLSKIVGQGNSLAEVAIPMEHSDITKLWSLATIMNIG